MILVAVGRMIEFINVKYMKISSLVNGTPGFFSFVRNVLEFLNVRVGM